jgi:hypothetical protein
VHLLVTSVRRVYSVTRSIRKLIGISGKRELARTPTIKKKLKYSSADRQKDQEILKAIYGICNRLLPSDRLLKGIFKRTFLKMLSRLSSTNDFLQVVDDMKNDYLLMKNFILMSKLRGIKFQQGTK